MRPPAQPERPARAAAGCHENVLAGRYSLSVERARPWSPRRSGPSRERQSPSCGPGSDAFGRASPAGRARPLRSRRPSARSGSADTTATAPARNLRKPIGECSAIDGPTARSLEVLPRDGRGIAFDEGVQKLVVFDHFKARLQTGPQHEKKRTRDQNCPPDYLGGHRRSRGVGVGIAGRLPRSAPRAPAQEPAMPRAQVPPR